MDKESNVAINTNMSEIQSANDAIEIERNRELCEYLSANDMCGWLEHDAWGGRGK